MQAIVGKSTKKMCHQFASESLAFLQERICKNYKHFPVLQTQGIALGFAGVSNYQVLGFARPFSACYCIPVFYLDFGMPSALVQD